MKISLKKIKLSYADQQVHALIFLPDPTKDVKPSLGVFTHGYTSHKASILSWPTRLAEEGMASILFDLPGHYLGGFSEVEDFESFKTDAPGLFFKALTELTTCFKQEFPLQAQDISPEEVNLVIGGHSLGALLSLLALNSGDFDEYKKKQSVCVGLGLPPEGVTHIFDTPFYKSTMNVRSQLVSPNLSPEQVFPWIKEVKETISMTSQKIHFITGQDDMVVSKDGSERMAEILIEKRNVVTVEKPTRLPHHQPELAASNLKKYLRSCSII